MPLWNFIILQKHPTKILCKKGVLKNFAIFTEKHLCWSLFAGLQVCDFINKRHQLLCSLHKKLSFPLRISSVNVTKSAVSCRFGHIYQRNPEWKTSFFVQWFSCKYWETLKHFILKELTNDCLVFYEQALK